MGKKNLILGGILVVLIAFAYIQKGPLQNMGKEKIDDNFLSGISISGIERMEIENQGKKIVLDKKEKGWKIDGTKDFYVKNVVATLVLETLDELSDEKLEVVSSNKIKKNEFETGDNGILVKFFNNGEEKSFVIGKNGPEYETTYISRENDDKTYLAKIDLRKVFEREEWRDDQIFSFIKERVNKVRFQYPKREFTAEKIENVWEGTKPSKFEVSEEKINAILDSLSDMRALKIPEQTFAGTGLEKNLIIIQASGIGVDETIMVGDKDKETGAYFVKKGSSDNIYLITPLEKEALDLVLSDLK